VPWNFARRNDDDVETDFDVDMLGMAREPQFSRADDPALGSFSYGFHRLVDAAACFHLDENETAAAPGDNVDFTKWRFPASGQDSIALGDQQ
jgi:hypothetical protein